MNDTDISLQKVICEVQDYLVPKLDSYEQMLYHYLFRHTYLEGRREITVGTRSLQTRIGLGIGKAGSSPSQRIVSDKLRTLESKGCIKVTERSVVGTTVEVLLPSEIPGLLPPSSEAPATPLESLDFFHDENRRLAILTREENRCFYCQRSLNEANFTLDHVQPRVNGVPDNTYRNLVACCFECNSRKQSTDVNSWLRQLYRDGLLTADEHTSRLAMLEALIKGELRPKII